MKAIQNSVGLGFELTFKKSPGLITLVLSKGYSKYTINQTMPADKDINEDALTRQINVINQQLIKKK